MFNEFLQILNLFLIYAFVGWVVEVIYHAVCQGVIVNRGFLNGPICPIYGFGMLLILYLLLPISDNLLVLFIGGIILTTAIELFGGWILEKLFHMRWWDYSKEPFNLHGYICLKFSLAWGLGVVIAVRGVHTIVAAVSDFVIRTHLKFILIPIFILFVIDGVATVITIMHLQKDFEKLEHMAKEIRGFSDALTDVIANRALETDQKLDEGRVQAALGKAEVRDHMNEQRETLENKLYQQKKNMQVILTKLSVRPLYGASRMLMAYPHAFMVRRKVRVTEFIDKIKELND